jgi:L-ribulose-5-phosphate 4-epimerase
MEIPRRGLAIYTFGNVSVLDRGGTFFAIKPSGVPYDDLAPADMVIVDLDGNTVDGGLNPSSDTPTHAVLYREWGGPSVGAVVHTHSPWATAWAQARRPIPCYGTTQADHLPGEVPCAPLLDNAAIEGAYEKETGMALVRHLADASLDPAGVPMIIQAGHGPFAWGATPEKAIYHAVVLEELARMALHTETINSGIEKIPKVLIDKHYLRKHGPGAYYGQSNDS